MPRYTMDTTKDFDHLLSEMAKEEGVTKSEIIRRSVSFYKFLRNEVIKEPNTKISITNEEDRVIKDIIMPFWQLYSMPTRGSYIRRKHEPELATIK